MWRTVTAEDKDDCLELLGQARTSNSFGIHCRDLFGFVMKWREFYLICCYIIRVRFNSSNCTQSQLASVAMETVSTETGSIEKETNKNIDDVKVHFGNVECLVGYVLHSNKGDKL